MKILLKYTFILLMIFFFQGNGFANERNDWSLFYTDKMCKEYINISSVKVYKSDKVGNESTCIEALIKTVYNRLTIETTIADLGLKNISNINYLSHRLFKIYIKPEEREIAWTNQIFYDENNNILLSKIEKTFKWEDVCPLTYEELYFSSIIDQFYHKGQFRNIEIIRNHKYDRFEQFVISKENLAAVRCFDKLSIRTTPNSVIYWAVLGDGDDTFLYRNELDETKKKNRLLETRYKGKDGLWINEKFIGEWKDIIPYTFSEDDANKVLTYIKQNTIENVN